MDKLDKPTFLRSRGDMSESNQKYTGLNPNESVADENARLKKTLHELIQSANRNQETQEKFYALELYFLESMSYESLLSRILNELKSKLRLTQLELLIVDPEKEIRQLIHEIYGELSFDSLHYSEDMALIRALYGGTIQIQLSQDESLIKKLFQSTAEQNLIQSQSQSHSVVLLPLLRGNKVIGSLHLGSRDKQRFHPGLASNFLHHLASIISVCIENSINQERYKHLSLVDILTRAKNRRYFFQILAKEIARATRSNKPLSCLFLDLDHFKQINDTHGHLIGDRTLRAVVKSITPLLRQSDVLARIGGEEFTVLLPNTVLSHAEEIAERIRELIAQLEIKNQQDQTFNLTVSIGVSNWSGEKKSEQAMSADAIQNFLIHQADQSVYRAKMDGRNCVRTI